MMLPQSPGARPGFAQSHVVRLLMVLALAVMLQIPVLMISGVISERRARRQEAVEDISSKWGRRQTVMGPALVVPYTRRWKEIGEHGVAVERTETRYATFLPERLAWKGRILGETRSRGIFTVPVYRARLQVEGEFSRPRFEEWNIPESDVAWDKAQIAVGISDVRAIQSPPPLTWNGGTLRFEPGPGGFTGAASGIHADVGAQAGEAHATFSFPLEINGSVGAGFAPFGRITTVDLESNWGNPSFQGRWLPVQRAVASGGFRASWSIPFLGRDYPQSWLECPGRATLDGSEFGVDLLSPLDEHRMAERSVKYAALFILLTFAALWLTEVLGRLRVHPIQYLLVGAALCLFYLLELSLSEHIGFGPAYLLATAGVVGMICAYTLAVLRNLGRVAAIGLTLGALYGYLYVLLHNEDYALLVGSIGLFAILGAVMFLTRKVDWYSPSQAAAVAE